MVVLALVVSGCVSTGKPQYEVENYLIDYPAPALDNHDTLNVSLKFNRFSIAAAYNSTNMIFRKDLNSLDFFNYSRWAVNPADMVADCLLRDLIAAGAFQAVLSRYDSDEGQFVVSGSVEEFYLRIGKTEKSAVVTIAILLKDRREADAGIVFQKKYTREEPLPESSPEGYSKAASQAMRVISAQVMNDIYTAVKSNIKPATNHP